MVRKRVAGRPETDDEDISTIVVLGDRALDVQRIPSREKPVNLEAPRQRQDFGQNPRLDLRDVHRVLLLEDAGLHAVVADAVARPWVHGVVDAHEREGRDDVAAPAHHVHLADLLVERTALERHAQRVLLHGEALGVDEPLGARVFFPLVAEDAVVDLLFDFALGHSAIGETEVGALPPFQLGANEKLLQRARSALGEGPSKLDEVLEVESLRCVERRPAVRAIGAVGASRREPSFDRVERKGDGICALGVRVNRGKPQCPSDT
jgi:hypothetical protein